MPFYVKNNGSWNIVEAPYVKNGGIWTPVTQGYVKDNGQWKLFYGIESNNTTSYNSAGSYSYTVPEGVYLIQVAATGGGGSGSVVFFNAGAYGFVNGATGGDTVVSPSSSGWSLTARGGYGGRQGSSRGTISVSGAESTTVSQTGGNNSGGTGGSSYYGSGSGRSGDFIRSSTPTYGAGSGGGFQDGSSTQGGDAGGTFIGTFSVVPGETISITVGAGGAARTSNYTRGGDHGSYSGTGGSGRTIITAYA